MQMPSSQAVTWQLEIHTSLELSTSMPSLFGMAKSLSTFTPLTVTALLPMMCRVLQSAAHQVSAQIKQNNDLCLVSLTRCEAQRAKYHALCVNCLTAAIRAILFTQHAHAKLENCRGQSTARISCA